MTISGRWLPELEGGDEYSIKYDEYSIENDEYFIKYDEYSIENDEYSIKYDEYSIENDECSITYDKYSIENDDYSIKKDEYSIENDENCSWKWRILEQVLPVVIFTFGKHNKNKSGFSVDFLLIFCWFSVEQWWIYAILKPSDVFMQASTSASPADTALARPTWRPRCDFLIKTWRLLT